MNLADLHMATPVTVEFVISMNEGCRPQTLGWSAGIRANGAIYTMSQPNMQLVSAGPTIAPVSLIFPDLNVTNLTPGEHLPIGFWHGAGGEYGPW